MRIVGNRQTVALGNEERGGAGLPAAVFFDKPYRQCARLIELGGLHVKKMRLFLNPVLGLLLRTDPARSLARWFEQS